MVGILIGHGTAQRVVKGHRPSWGRALVVRGPVGIDPATAAGHLERYALEGGVGLVVVDGKHNGVVVSPRSRFARLDGPAHPIVEGARDGPAVLAVVRLDLLPAHPAPPRSTPVAL